MLKFRNSLTKVLLTALTLVSMSAFSATVIVVHPENAAAISEKDVKRIFLGKEKKFSDGKETLPINQQEGAAARESFDSGVLGRSSSQVAAYWSKLVFTGKGIPPKEVPDDAAVIEIVANNKNAIGYVDESAVSGNVKVIKLN